MFDTARSVGFSLAWLFLWFLVAVFANCRIRKGDGVSGVLRALHFLKWIAIAVAVPGGALAAAGPQHRSAGLELLVSSLVGWCLMGSALDSFERLRSKVPAGRP